MSEFTIITAGDVHISDSNPRSRTDNYKEAIFDKIRQIRTASLKLKADAVIFTGDLFNLKNPARNSHSLTRELIETFREFKCPVYMIPGNHDLTSNNLDSIVQQPLGVLFASKAVNNLQHEILTKKGAKLSLVGIPFMEDPDFSKIPPKDDCIAQVCVMHVYAGPTSGKVFKERLWGYSEFLNLSPDIFVFGHYHLDQGVEELEGKYFVNLGSISRGVLATESLEHQPKISVIKILKTDESRSIAINVIPLNVRPSDEIFNVQKWEEQKREETEIEQFVDHLIQASSLENSEKDFEAIIEKLDVGKEVKKKALYFISEAIATNVR